MDKKQRKELADKLKDVVEDLGIASDEGDLDEDTVSDWQDSINEVIDGLNDGEGEIE